MKYDLDKGAHSKYYLYYHYICCVKYRKKVFDNEKIIDRLKQINKNISLKLDIEIINQETELDHIHILFKAKPTSELTKFINSLKGVSARYLLKEFPVIKSKL